MAKRVKKNGEDLPMLANQPVDPAELCGIVVTTGGRIVVGNGGALQFHVLITRQQDYEWKVRVEWINHPRVNPPRFTKHSQLWSSHEAALMSALRRINHWVEWIVSARCGIKFSILIDIETKDMRK